MLGLRESDLVAVRMPPGRGWLDVISDVRSSGGAFLPIDDRLPASEVDALLARARPTTFFDGSTLTRLDDGEPCAPGLVIATSGSSGEARAVCLSWDAVDAATGASIARLGATADEPWLSCLPLSHMGGLLVLLRAPALGAPLWFGPFEPGAALASIVPTQLARAVRDGIDLSSFKALLVGGAPLDEALTARAPVVHTYGLTESAGGVVYDGVPLDGVRMRIAGDEIQLAGPTLMSGYRLDDAATTAAFTDDGWLRTRDAGIIADDTLIVHGRLDDVINTGGEKVWPDEVEPVLRAHPRVADVAVAGRPDPEWGARVVAYVVPDGHPPTLHDLRAQCRELLAPHKAPRELVLVEQLPRTALGKIARARLLVDPDPHRR